MWPNLAWSCSDCVRFIGMTFTLRQLYPFCKKNQAKRTKKKERHFKVYFNKEMLFCYQI